MISPGQSLHKRGFSVCVVIICTGFACAEPKAENGERAPLDTLVTAQRAAPEPAHCYRSSQSALFGPITKSRQSGKGPGWLRVTGLPIAESGSAELVDANRAGLGGSWHRGPRDSVSITVADDFLRVELHLAVSDSVAMGSALALSDADIERDASGKLRTFRRGWFLRASRVPCDSMPVRSTHGAP